MLTNLTAAKLIQLIRSMLSQQFHLQKGIAYSQLIRQLQDRPKHASIIQHADASIQLEIDKLQKILPQCQATQLQVLMTFLASTQDHPRRPVLHIPHA